MSFQLPHQWSTPDMAVKTLNIRPADVFPLRGLQAAGHSVNGPSSPPMALVMLAKWVDRQDVMQLHRHPFQNHRILCRPDSLFILSPPHYLHRAQAVPALRDFGQQVILYLLPVKPQVPDICIRRRRLTSPAAPLKGGFQLFPLSGFPY
ncbi:TPA: hypothetical protein M4731_003628 [Salmonella enterica]|nr:hypothetical protein [Salmonella enterica]MCH5736152.1 hypothetical protein [Salmonella enterica]MCH5745081.1 hypothetical protein [Salmonella enterica]MCH5745875.1 hypothetical protein [Salmonella enterica]MCH5755047.1 hypothetical protein [Salmonella enterica]